MTPVQGSAVADDEIDLGQLLGVLWKGKLWIGAAAVLGVVLAAFVFVNTEKTFQADALLQLEEKAAALALSSSLSGMVDSDPRSVTEIEILRSRLVLGQAVADLNLDWRVTPDRAPVIGVMLTNYRLALLDPVVPDRFARHGESLTLAELIVPPNWVNTPITLDVTGEGRFEVRLPGEDRVQGQVGVPLSLAEIGFRMTVGNLATPPGRRFEIRQIDENTAINDLRQRVSISERGRSSGILEARLTGPDRLDNPRALNAILTAYQRQNVARSAAQAEGSLRFIRDQLPQAEASLREAENALNLFRQAQVSVDLSIETQTILNQITRVETELAELQRREDELAQRFTPAHPTYRLLLDERSRLERRLTELRGQIGDLPETQRQIVNLTRDLELAQRLHTQLLTRAQEVEVLRASTIGNVRVIDGAAPGPRPIAPRSTLILALGLVLGVMTGIAVVLLRNWLRKGIQDATELERLGLPVLATINYNRQSDSQGRRKGNMPILAIEQPDDLSVEAFRSLRTSLHFGMLDAATPTLAITSSHPGAGKSFVSTNLAVVSAQAGHRVCLIDADMRRGQLRRYFGLPRSQPGLAEVLAGDRPIRETLVAGPVAGLQVLTTGRYPPNPSELLMRAELSELIAWCAQHFDLTIFDAPPVLAVTDPIILSRATGAAILVARHDMTLPGELDAVMKTYAAAGLRLSGAILNGFDPRKAKTGYGYGYGYGYRYAYKQRGE